MLRFKSLHGVARSIGKKRFIQWLHDYYDSYIHQAMTIDEAIARLDGSGYDCKTGKDRADRALEGYNTSDYLIA